MSENKPDPDIFNATPEELDVTACALAEGLVAIRSARSLEDAQAIADRLHNLPSLRFPVAGSFGRALYESIATPARVAAVRERRAFAGELKTDEQD